MIDSKLWIKGMQYAAKDMDITEQELSVMMLERLLDSNNVSNSIKEEIKQYLDKIK